MGHEDSGTSRGVDMRDVQTRDSGMGMGMNIMTYAVNLDLAPRMMMVVG